MLRITLISIIYIVLLSVSSPGHAGLLAKQHWVDYMIFVSTAISWIDQSNFLTVQRINREKKAGLQETRTALIQNEKMNNLILDERYSYDDYVESLKSKDGSDNGKMAMNRDRFEFVKMNIAEDATANLSEIKVPVLALFGEDDLNVDIENTLSVYQRVFRESQVEYSYRVFPDATHALSKSRYFNKTVPGLMDVLKMNLLGRDFFADGVLDSIADFAQISSASD